MYYSHQFKLRWKKYVKSFNARNLPCEVQRVNWSTAALHMAYGRAPQTGLIPETLLMLTTLPGRKECHDVLKQVKVTLPSDRGDIEVSTNVIVLYARQYIKCS